jgi:hypothetical protein
MSSGSKAPNYPEMSAEEKQLLTTANDVLKKQGVQLDAQDLQNKELLNLAKDLSGLYTNGQINPEAVAAMRTKIGVAQADQERISALERENYERALRGEAPLSEGTIQRGKKDFAVLKENLARRGTRVTGDTPETAVANSTAGVQTLESFATAKKVAEDAERRGYLGFGASTVDRYNPGSVTNPVASMVPSFGPGATSPAYSNLSSGYLGLTQPYAQQRSGQFQAAISKSNQPGMLPGLVDLGVTAGSAYLFGPYGPIAVNAAKNAKAGGYTL